MTTTIDEGGSRRAVERRPREGGGEGNISFSE